jgi:hypothetical protein
VIGWAPVSGEAASDAGWRPGAAPIQTVIPVNSTTAAVTAVALLAANREVKMLATSQAS